MIERNNQNQKHGKAASSRDIFPKIIPEAQSKQKTSISAVFAESPRVIGFLRGFLDDD